MNFYNILEQLKMRYEKDDSMAVAAMSLFGGQAITECLIQPDMEHMRAVETPFWVIPKYVLSERNVVCIYKKQQYLSPSTATVMPISVNVVDAPEIHSPSELVQAIRYLCGMTWAQVAEIFSVSLRAVFDWAAGKPVSPRHHEHLGNVFATLEYIDRGSAEENMNLLMSKSQEGITCFQLLKNDQCDLIRDIAGEGPKRPSFKADLSEDAKKYNAPIHFGHSIENALNDEDMEIVVTGGPKIRRVKARRKKA